MKRLAMLPVLIVVTLPVALGVALYVGRTAWAEPAFGGSCLGCHSELVPGAAWVYRSDAVVDPDESSTGAPDRGPLATFRACPGHTKVLHLQVAGLNEGDTYAVQLKRLRFPGVVVGGQLSYSADCAWAEWGETAHYYSEPEIAHRWGTGPATFTYEIEVEPDAAFDYYDLVFAVAGKFGDNPGLYYAEEHFYLQVMMPRVGDCDCDGDVDFEDINYFVAALSGEQVWVNYHVSRKGEPPACPYSNCDANLIPPVNFEDINAFVQLLGG